MTAADDILAAFTADANHVTDHGDEPVPDRVLRALGQADEVTP
jgi:hypothetical protein